MSSSEPPPSTSETSSYLDTVAGEIAFFKALTRHRPVGINRDFHVICINTFIRSTTTHDVPPEEIMRKLASCYELDTLDAIDMDAETYDDRSGTRPSPTPASPMSPSQNLNTHPYFHHDFSTSSEDQIFPSDPFFESLIAQRRLANTPSPPASPTPEPIVEQPETPSRKGAVKATAKNETMGPGSDTSDLTQDSADEEGDDGGDATTAGGTDAGTDGEDMDVDEKDGHDDDDEVDAVPPPRKRGRKRGGPPNNPRGRGAGRGKPAAGRKTKR